MFYQHTLVGKILLIVYVDDIVITRDDRKGILELKMFLQTRFQTKDLGQLRYFLGIEVARSQHSIIIVSKEMRS